MINPTEVTVLQHLRAGHPRLLALPEDVARVRRFVAEDAVARACHDRLRARGEAMLGEPPVERVVTGIPGYMAMLGVSRTALDRVYTLAFLYRVDGDARWAQRAIEEMLAMADFVDWHPPHWLDVAEMMHAMAIGYDWLYDVLTPAQRQTVKAALVEKGLHTAETAYREQPWWVRNAFNWNNVCNGAVIVGALAVADEEPELAGRLITQALEHLPCAMASYAPDGAWAEGPGYWGYASRYTTAALAAMESALGTDAGISALPGVAEAGLFRLHGVGPTGMFFNFADAAAWSGPEPALFWFARRFDSPLLAYGARRSWEVGKGGGAFGAEARSLLWFDPRGSENELRAVSLDSHYAGTHLAFFRSSWTDPDARYVGFKGGDNKANHGHLDLGTFVFDALGERWAIDLGPDVYTLPGYWDERRWSYYRLGTPGHNTLTLDGANQDPGAVAPIIAYRSAAGHAFAIADLTAAYRAEGATRVHRGIALMHERTALLVQDEVEAERPVEIAWAMHTHAAIILYGNRALLQQGGKTVEAKILAPEGACFAVEEIDLAPPQEPTPNVRKLLVRLPRMAAAQITVLLAPESMGIEPTPIPLEEWS